MPIHPDFDLFTEPSSQLSGLPNVPPPSLAAQITPASTGALLRILKDNYEKWHIFFNDAKFHNHTAHTTIALWSLGATEDVLNTSYSMTESYQRPLYDSPEEITRNNWKEHLGDVRFYKAYLSFFASELEKNGVHILLKEYIFSPGANFRDVHTDGGTNGVTEVDPEMLSRTLDSIMHPFIHIGYGLELNLPSMVVEGLAQAALHNPSSTALISREVLGHSLVITGNEGGVHSLNILSRIMGDASFADFKPLSEQTMYREVMESFGPAIKGYVDQWLGEIDSISEEEGLAKVEKKSKEMIWLVTIIYGVCGSQCGSQDPNQFNADFFFAHFVTSAHFLPPFLAHIDSPRGRFMLLRSYLSVVLGWYIGRGRPVVGEKQLEEFFSDSNESLDLQTKADVSSRNATWSKILQSALRNPDEHVPKLQRSLKYFDELLGDSPCGTFVGMGPFATPDVQVHKGQGIGVPTELEGAHHIDGTLFVRSALLSAEKFGWLVEGEGLGAERAIDRGHGAASGTVKNDDKPNGKLDIDAELAKILASTPGRVFPWDRKGFYN